MINGKIILSPLSYGVLDMWAPTGPSVLARRLSSLLKEGENENGEKAVEKVGGSEKGGV